MAVNFLSDDLDREMYLENDEKVTTSALLSTVAAQYNMTLESYIEVRDGDAIGIHALAA
jgi:hypothetical protein